MSASNRSLARLPLDIFRNLVSDRLGGSNVDDDDDRNSSSFEYVDDKRNASQLIDPAKLRSSICQQLKSFSRRKNNGTVMTVNVTTVGQLLQLSKLTLLRALDPLLTYVECDEFLRRVCLHCSSQPTTSWELLQSTWNLQSNNNNTTMAPSDDAQHTRLQSFLPTVIPALDQHLRGGLRFRSLTEFVGPAGSGKTQMALQLCVEAARYGYGSVYIDTEKKLSLPRLHQIATLRHDLYEKQDYIEKENQPHQPAKAVLAYPPSDVVLSNVTVHTPENTDELLNILAAVENDITMQLVESSSLMPVRLLVLDSIAAPTRRDFGSDSAVQRAAIVMSIAQTLKRLADTFQLAIVVINQASRVLSTENQSFSNDHHRHKAALGVSWHHCVSTRIFVDNSANTTKLGSQHGGLSFAQVTKSNVVAKSGKIPFVISSEGVNGM